MRRWAISLAGVCVLGGGLGCGKLADSMPKNPDEDEVYSTPTGDGSHYVAIFSEPTTPPVAMARRWNKHATKVCEGEYLVLSENASERRSGGFVESRVHEGWVRCLSPDVTLDEAQPDKAPKKKLAAERPAPVRLD